MRKVGTGRERRDDGLRNWYRVIAEAGPRVTTVLHSIMEGPNKAEESEGINALVARYRKIFETYQPPEAGYLRLHRGHMMFLRPEEKPLITADVIRDWTFTGTVDELSDRVRALRDAGYMQWATHIVPGHEDSLEDWARVMDRV